MNVLHMYSRRGMTFVEVVFAMAILAILLLGLLGSFLGSASFNEVTAQETVANNAAQQKLEEAIGMTKRYETATDEDYPYANGYLCPNPDEGRTYPTDGKSYRFTYLDAMIAYYQENMFSSFDVEGLNPADGNDSVGQVILHLVEANIPTELGGPTDLNGDGDTDDDLSGIMQQGWANLAKTEYVGAYNTDVVPVEVVIEWQSKSGPITMQRFTTIARTSR